LNDTPPDVEQRYREMLLALPGARRLEMGASMHATARALARAGILARRPDATEVELRQALFLHFYGDDFSPRDRERILAWLAPPPAPP
jgi:hypothetical protein